MQFLYVIVFLIIIGAIVYICPMDAPIKNLIYVLCALGVVLYLLSVFFPGHVHWLRFN